MKVSKTNISPLTSPRFAASLPVKSYLKNKVFLLVVILIFTVVVVPDVTINSFFRDQPANFYPAPVIKAILMSLAILGLVSSWGIVLITVLFPKRAPIAPATAENPSHQNKIGYKALIACQSCMICSATLYFAFLLVFRSGSNNSKCFTPLGTGDWNCNPYKDVPIFPIDTAFILMMIPISFAIVMKEKRRKITMVSWFISLCGIVASAITLGSLSSFPIVILYIFMSAVVLLDNFRLHTLVTKLHNSLAKSMQETQALLDQQKLNQMRDVIGNVSHDLKTPLSSFMQGIDLMIDITTEFEEKICPSVLKSELYTNFFHEMKMHMRNIRNTNAFMMMSINRTMDYTKASRGLKLVPSMDTIDLLETLSLPLNCMKNIQNRVLIHLLPIHSVICNYIVTDKQWLQENILCLLSNSAKYSSDGEVTVKVSLRSKRSPYLESRNKLIDPSSPESSMQLKSTSTMVKSFDRDAVVPFDKPETKETPKKNYLLFEVEDNGIGMEKETMLSLFSPFKQAQRLAGGTGLGLYSLSKRIESLEGDYGVRERKDGKPGCLFWFTIPYIPDPSLVPAFEAGKQFVGSFDTCMDTGITGLVQQSQPLRSPLTSHPGSPTGEKRKLAHAYSVPSFALKSKLENLSHHDENPGTSTTATTNNFPMTTANSVPTILIDEVTSIDHKKARFEGIITEVSLHILLVEDSPTIAKMTSLLLTKLGYRVTHAENGHIALKKMIESKENRNGHPFDLVLMDFQMPVMDGLEATKRYREYEKLHPSDQHPLIIIGLSATFDKEIVQDAMKMGLDDYLMKPIQKDTFLKKIEKVFQKVSNTSLQQPGVSHLSSGSTVMEDVDEQRLFLECHG